MEIIEKAYNVWHSGMISRYPDEGYQLDDLPITYAKSPSEAKSKAHEPMNFDLDGERPKYTDLKVRRVLMFDKVLFEGNVIVRWVMEENISTQKKIDERRSKIEAYPDDTNFYIQNGFVGNAIVWWGLGSSGYETDITKAQIYTKQEILERFVGGREQDRIWEAKHVLTGIKQVVDIQKLSGEFVA